MVSGNFDIPRSWIICHGPFSINVPPIITATIHNNFYCSEQYRCMVFALPTYRPSFRDIEICLRSHAKKLYHLGIRRGIFRNILANKNQSHDRKISTKFSKKLFRITKCLHFNYALSGINVDDSICALNTTTTDLCLSLFP